MRLRTKSSRRAERIFAFKVLYGVSFSSITSLEELKAQICSIPEQEVQAINNFTWSLIAGTWLKQKELDQVLTQFSQNWKVHRIAKVELTLLRLALYELLFQEDQPVRVVINEAIELSKEFGDDKSRSFINGILNAVLKALDSCTLQRQSFSPPQLEPTERI